MEAPILKSRDWRYLLRDLVNAHAWLRPVQNSVLQLALAPAASMAWWIAGTMPELLERESLTILLPGAGAVEFADEGRWFALLPWMLGRPRMKTRLILVGKDLRAHGRSIASAARPHIARMDRCDSFDGTVGQWRAAHGRDTDVNVCGLFGPTFTENYRAWLADDGILPLLRQCVPVGVFSGSGLEALEDQAALAQLDVRIEHAPPTLNPWRITPEGSDGAVGFAHSAWSLKPTAIPDNVNFEASGLHAFLELQRYGRVDFDAYGGVTAVESLGMRWPVPASEAAPADALITLPRNHGIRESTGEVGYFHPEGFSLLTAPRLIVPADKLASRPTGDDVMARICWALGLQRNWIAPRLESSLAPDTGRPKLDDALLGAVSSIDPEAWRQKRVVGIERGPTHPHWAILFNHIGWAIDSYQPAPVRFEPAFTTPAPRRDCLLPVFCEPYGYVPGEADDEEANEAMRTVARTCPDGAILVFNLMPYREVGGDKYQFGGMLLWENAWRPFALNRQIRSADDVIDQVQSGFSFETVDRKYADNRCQLAIPFNQMCRGMSPDARPESVSLTKAPWIWVLPDTRDVKPGEASSTH